MTLSTITYNPETHQLVPKEPIQEMLDAGKLADPLACDVADDDFTIQLQIFKAMCANAPELPAVVRDETALFEAWRNDQHDDHTAHGDATEKSATGNGSYKWGTVQKEWQAWLAAVASLTKEK